MTWMQDADIDSRRKDAGTQRCKYVGMKRCWDAGYNAATETRIIDTVVMAWEWADDVAVKL